MDIRVSDEPAVWAAEAIARRITDAVRRRGRASLALSGGSTAPSLISSLLERPITWESITVWQVDERVAPDGDADRNANQLAGLPCAVMLMPVTDTDLRSAADRYGRSLPDRFDVVHLGVGDDGHTASWPPGDTATPSSARPVELVAEFNGRPRMTLTEAVVNAARARIVLASGAGKRPVVQRWLLGDESLPITRVRQASTVVFLDPAAAPGV